jgi:hypothetical protein
MGMERSSSRLPDSPLIEVLARFGVVMGLSWFWDLDRGVGASGTGGACCAEER